MAGYCRVVYDYDDLVFIHEQFMATLYKARNLFKDSGIRVPMRLHRIIFVGWMDRRLIRLLKKGSPTLHNELAWHFRNLTEELMAIMEEES